MLRLFRNVTPRSVVVLLVAQVALLSCKVGEQDPPPCENDLVASFHVTLRAPGGALPADTRLFVRHGGGQEAYELSAAQHHSQVVFCNLLDADAGADAAVADAQPSGDGGDAGVGSVVGALDCELWTNGAATVDVQAHGYLPLIRSLTAESNGCGGFRTVNAELLLAPLADGGA